MTKSFSFKIILLISLFTSSIFASSLKDYEARNRTWGYQSTIDYMLPDIAFEKEFYFDFDQITKNFSLEEQMNDSKTRNLIDIYLGGKSFEKSDLQLLINGGNSFLKKMELLKEAKVFVLFQSLTFIDDRTGLKFLPIIDKKLNEGVVFRFLLDAVASWRGNQKFYEDLDFYIRNKYKELKHIYPQFEEELKVTTTSIWVYKSPRGKFRNSVIQHDEENKTLSLERFNYKIKKVSETFSAANMIRVMHTKMIAIDGKYAITGGMNHQDHYSYGGLGEYDSTFNDFYPDTSFYNMSKTEMKIIKKMTPNYYKKIVKQWGEHFEKKHMDPGHGWRDTDVLVTGKMAKEMTKSFLRSWEYVVTGLKKNGIKGMGVVTSLKKAPDNPSSHLIMPKAYVEDHDKVFKNVLMRKVEHIPQIGETYYVRLLRWLLASAKTHIACQMPYMVMSDHMRQWIREAAARGVKVDLYTNSIVSNDVGAPMTWIAREMYYDIVKDNPENVSIYEWQNPTLHSKACIVDDYVSVIGSSNHDYTSDYFSFELAITAYDKEVAKVTKAMFEKDKTFSKRISLAKIKSWYKKSAFDKNGDKKKEKSEKGFKGHFGMELIKQILYRPMIKTIKRILELDVITH